MVLKVDIVLQSGNRGGTLARAWQGGKKNRSIGLHSLGISTPFRIDGCSSSIWLHKIYGQGKERTKLGVI